MLCLLCVSLPLVCIFMLCSYARNDVDLLPLRLLRDTLRQFRSSRLDAATGRNSRHNNLDAIM
jgi:hypothetical protein